MITNTPMAAFEQHGLVLSDDQSRVDVSAVHAFLQNAYWSEQIPKSTVEKAIANSLCFGVYDNQAQVAFARVVTDYATFAYLADVFVLPAYRGRGVSKWMISVIVSDARLQGLRRWLLATRDAHGLYSQFGFERLLSPERWMEIAHKDLYKTKA